MPSNLPVAPKAAAYKRYLTSIWHTRWLRAAAVALLWHLSVSAVYGDWYSTYGSLIVISLLTRRVASISSFFWSVFPLGPAGLRAGLFWITSLVMFTVPLSTFKIGRRCTPSNWSAIKNLISNPLTPATIFLWHALSAFWFCQVFVYWSPPSQELAWVSKGDYGSPDRLNERPIYLFAFLQVLGLAHAVWYILEDKSSMSLPTKSLDDRTGKAEDEAITTRIFAQAPIMIRDAALVSAVSTALTVLSYSTLFRRPLWRFTIAFAKAFANMARSDAEPPNRFYIGAIILKATLIGCLLSMTWQLDNLLFKVFMVSAPVRNTLPLSASSKDPNGTLLNGLTRKSDLIKTFAFWELLIISESQPARRKEIFADIERPNSAPMSSLIVNAGVDVINSIERRIADLDSSAGPPAQNSVSDAHNNEVQHLPRLLPNAVAAKNPVLLPSNPTALHSGLDRMGGYISHEARILGSSSNPWSPPLQKGKQLAIEYSSPAIHDLRSRAEAAQQSPLGRYLLTQPVRQIESVVLGTPTGNPTLVMHAVKSITNLLVASLDEDTYGKAVPSVPPTIQAMTRAIFAIEQVIRKYTDGVVTQTDARHLQEVLVVRQHMKSCLKDLLEKFGSFLRDVGLSIRDLNEAQKAAEDRELFEVLQPATADSSPRQDGSATGKEMEEISQSSRHGSHGQNRHSDHSRGEQNVRKQLNDGERRKQRGDVERPGRLFPQLDEGSAIDKAWRDKRTSGDGRANPNQNGSTAVRSRRGSRPEMTDNVLGVRDINVVSSTTGLSRRRTQAT